MKILWQNAILGLENNSYLIRNWKDIRLSEISIDENWIWWYDENVFSKKINFNFLPKEIFAIIDEKKNR